MLTDAILRTLEPQAKTFKKYDADGLFILVMNTGSMLWRLKYKWKGRSKGFSLGKYPDVTLKRARELRDEARKQLANSTDPGRVRQEAKLADRVTFKDIGAMYVASKANVLAPNSLDIEQQRVEKFNKAFGPWPFTDIKEPDLLAFLKRVEGHKTYETAHRLRALFNRINDFAIAHGKATRNITVALRGALTPVETKHFAAVTEPREISKLLNMIDSYDGYGPVAYALKVAPYVFLRPIELRAAEWREIDFAACEWRVPKERMKSKEPHIVPLAPQVVTLLRELQTLTGAGKFLFPGLRPGKPISDNTINASLRYLGVGKDEMTCHGFRSLASTRLNELGVKRDEIELQMAHVEQNRTRAAYNRVNRASLLPQRRAMMELWANELDRLRALKPEAVRASKRSSAGATAAA